MSATEKYLLMITSIKQSGNFGFGPVLVGSALLATLIFGVVLAGLIARNYKKNGQMREMRSEMTGLEEYIRQLSAKNDWLVTEMHHRVKNNLQILSSLINSQLSFIKDKTGRDALANSKHRLHAMSLVHQKLFLNAADTCIEASCCIKELVDYLADEYQSRDWVTFELDLMELKADVSFAIPFELIMNELLTNSLKFAFPKHQKGKVSISLHTKDQMEYELVYADNGIGLPDDIDLHSERSMGRSLIMGLSRQIKAQVSVNNSNGLEIKMDFRIPQQQHGHFGIC